MTSRRPRNRSHITPLLSRSAPRWLGAIALIIGLGSTTIASAHGPRDGRADRHAAWQNMSEAQKTQALEARRERRVAHMTAELDLSEAQQAEVRRILTQAHQKKRAMLDADQQTSPRRGLRADVRRQIRDVLTDEQAEIMRAKRAQRRAQRPARITKKLDRRLSLDETQRAQIEAILSEAQRDVAELRDTGSDRQGLRAARREIMNAAAADIAAVLDEQQAAEFETMREQRRAQRIRGGSKQRP